jgi:putative ABC transport system permease protein
VRLALALYALAVLAFPRTMRRAHRGEMTALFEQSLRDARLHGALATAATALRAYCEIVAAGIAERGATLARDLRYTWRTLLKAPLFTAVVIATFGLAIGGTTSVLAVVDGVMLSPLPWPNADRLVVLNQRLTMGGTPLCVRCSFDSFDVDTWKRLNHTFLQIGEYSEASRVLGGTVPVRVAAMRVDEGYFPALGATPMLGRFVTAGDRRVGAPPVAVISAAAWRTRSGADPHVLGERVVLDGVTVTIVGVAADGFADPTVTALRGDGSLFWTPLALPSSDPRSLSSADVIGRLRPGLAVAAAGSDVQRLIDVSRARTRNALHGTPVLTSVREMLLGDVRPTMVLAVAAVLIVLAIACANVSSLLLARGATRRREIAVRTALGAGNARIVAQLLTETLALALCGAVLGVVLAGVALHAFAVFGPREIPRLTQVGLDLRVLAVVAGVTIVAALCAGLAPAFDLARGDVDEALKGGERGGSDRRGTRLREGFVTAQVALALAVVVLGGLVARSLVAYTRTDLGFAPHGLYAAAGKLPPMSLAQRQGALDRLRGRVAALPGIEHVTISDTVPLRGYGTYTMSVEGHHPATPFGDILYFDDVDPAYFATLGMALTQGRGFDPRAQPRREAIVSQAFVRQYFAHGSVLGARIFDGVGHTAESAHTIVGVVADVPIHSLVDAPQPVVYLRGDFAPMVPAFTSFMLTVRSPLSVATVRREIDSAWSSALGTNHLPEHAGSMDEVVSVESARVRTVSILLGLLGVVALTLAATGLYGVMAFSVERRTREIGIRMALGSSPGRVLRLMLRRGILLAAIGVVAGFAVSLALSRSVEPFLYRVSTTDPPTYAAVALGLIVVASIASYIPARRATKVDPMQALRYE